MFKAFKDTWRWDQESSRTFQELLEGGPSRVAQAMRAFQRLMPKSDMLAYLSMMTPRLVELHRVLKPTGSLYLHCDPTASHYLKLLLDAVFGTRNFLGEIVWRRTSSHVSYKRWPRLHDILLHYAKNHKEVYFNPPRTLADEGWTDREYRHNDTIGRYMLDNLTGAGTREGPSGQPWRGVDPAKIGAGRHWRYIPETLEKLDREGRIYWPKKGKYPKLKHYLVGPGGKAVGDLWSDISVIGRTAAERLGYPTQKPRALLDRIVEASSQPGDVILDPFCGCGTAIASAQSLGRMWVGIDITHLAISLIKHRLFTGHGSKPKTDYEVQGEPEDLESAKSLAIEDRHKFQVWAVGRLTAQPLGDTKKGKDSGIDGRVIFHDGNADDESKEVIISVKSGKPKVSEIRNLNGVVRREGAEIGVMVTLESPTRDMAKEAADAGYYSSPWDGGKKYARLQIITVRELLAGKQIECPPWSENRSFKKAPKTKKRERPDTCMLPFRTLDFE